MPDMEASIPMSRFFLIASNLELNGKKNKCQSSNLVKSKNERAFLVAGKSCWLHTADYAGFIPLESQVLRDKFAPHEALHLIT